jgi:hypothetical protein
MQLEHKGDAWEYAHQLRKGDLAVSAAVKGNKAVPKKRDPKKATPKKAGPKKTAPNKTVRERAAPKKSATKKQAFPNEPKKVENLMAGREVRRKFTMTVQVSGDEYLADPVAATRRVLILALTKIPAKIHEEQIDSGSIYNGLFNTRADIHFNGVLNDPKNPTGADLHSPTCGNSSRSTVRKRRARAPSSRRHFRLRSVLRMETAVSGVGHYPDFSRR